MGGLPNIVEGSEHTIRRSNVFKDVLQLYQMGSILQECPIRIEFEDEMAIDQGGVTRDMFSAFWDECHSKLFEGLNLLVPLLHPQSDTSIFPIIGRIISHGYLVCGFLPVCVALPCLLCILCGPGTVVPQQVLQDAFLDYISTTEKSIFKEALNASTFTEDVKEKLMNTLSRFGCRQMPTPAGLVKCLEQIACHEFCSKPTAAAALAHSGIAASHSSFWCAKGARGICSIYKTLTVSVSRVFNVLEFPLFQNPAEERVCNYLQEMVGNMNQAQLQKFLRFATGSSVLVVKMITIQFNGLSGFGRRPIAHTCDCILELPVAYENYHDFFSEWLAINDNDLCWRMDAC